MRFAFDIDNEGNNIVLDLDFYYSLKIDKTVQRRINSVAEPNTYDQIIRDATVTALREIARFAGYRTLENGKKAIKADLNKIYIVAKEMGEWLAAKSKGRKDNRIWQAMAEGKLGPYRKHARQRGFKPLDFTSDIDAAAVDKAHGRQMAMRKVQYFIKKGQETAFIREQSDRVGVIGGTIFWQAALDLNPKARPKKLDRIKTKAQRKTRGSERRKTSVKETIDTIIAEVIGSHDKLDNVYDFDGIVSRAIRYGEEQMHREILIRDLTLETQRQKANKQ